MSVLPLDFLRPLGGGSNIRHEQLLNFFNFSTFEDSLYHLSRRLQFPFVSLLRTTLLVGYIVNLERTKTFIDPLGNLLHRDMRRIDLAGGSTAPSHASGRLFYPEAPCNASRCLSRSARLLCLPIVVLRLDTESH
jgi:hypothetical protein